MRKRSLTATPKNVTPAMITMAIMATIRPYSTAGARRSSRSGVLGRFTMLTSCGMRRTGVVARTTPVLDVTASAGSERAGDVVEEGVEVVAQQGDGADDDDGDQRDHQAVL